MASSSELDSKSFVAQRRDDKARTFVVKGDNADSGERGDFGSHQGDHTYHKGKSREVLKRLLPYANTPIAHLPSAASADLNKVKGAAASLRKDKALYPMFMGDVRDIFSGVHSVGPGTVGAYMLGCTTKGYSMCDGVCAGALPPVDNPMATCDKNVYFVQSNGSISRISQSPISHDAVVFWQAYPGVYTPAQIAVLNADGITMVTTQVFGKNTPENTVPLTSLPTVAPLPGGGVVTGKDIKASSTAGTVWVIVLIVIIIILIIIIIAFAVKRGHGGGKAPYGYSQPPYGYSSYVY